MISIFTIDKEQLSLKFFKNMLEKYGYNSEGNSDLSESIKYIKNNQCDLILADLSLYDINANELLKQIKQINPHIEIIFFTEFATIQSAVELMKLGAFDYMVKPIDINELIVKIERAINRKRMNEEIERLQSLFRKEYGIDKIIAHSKEMLDVLHKASVVAESDGPILIQGESGTGKELIARAIHISGRSGKQFVPINCGAMPETLLESEMFGYMKGAFTGARFNKKGLFEEANGGTIFLDEIGDMSLATQVKLLRALDFGEIRRIGSNIPVYVDTRVVTATNKDIKTLVSIDKFRQDLYYRLNFVIITIPPLRERKADIIPLANHYLKIFGEKMNKEVLKLAPETRQILLKYNWHGNVRELVNVIERAIVIAQYDTVFPEDLPSNILHEQPNIITQAIKENWTLKKLEDEYIAKVIKECSWKLSQSAKMLGIARNSLWRKLKNIY